MTRSIFCAVGVLLLSACGDGPDRISASCQQGALITPQGHSLNATFLNAMFHNGAQLNAYFLNGYWANAAHLNAMWHNGTMLQGVSLNGLWHNGPFVQSPWLNGRWYQGPVLQGHVLQGLGLNGSRLVALDAGGAEIPGVDFVGAFLKATTSTGEIILLEITATETDEDQGITYYSLALGGQNICGEGDKGLFVPGIWDETGRHVESVEAAGESFTASYSCTSGVIAKCVRWGYKPWTEGAAIHQTCTRMARADYCGDGVPHTENGTLINIYDVRNIQVSEPSEALTFEAAWGPDGAVCVRESRYVDVDGNGDRVYPSCWADKPRCDSLREGRVLGALIADDSAHESRLVCE